MDKIKLLIVDDHALVRRGMKDLMGEVETIEVVGEASDGYEGLAQAKETLPDVVLTDLNMPNCDGVEATRLLDAEVPSAKVLMLTISDREPDLADAIKAGARGYVLKNEDSEMIVQAIQHVADGGVAVAPSMNKKLASALVPEKTPEVKPSLNMKEKKLLRLFAQTGSHQVVASRLKSTAQSVRTDLNKLMRKVKVTNRGEATEYAKEIGVLPGRQTAVPDQVGSGSPTPVRPKPSVVPKTERPVEARASETPVDKVMGRAIIIVGPPYDMKDILKLQTWMQSSAEADLVGISAWGSDLMVDLDIKKAIPLFSMLEDLPLTSGVTREPPSPDEPAAKRFRLTLQP